MKPKFNIGQIVYLKNPQYIYGKKDIRMEFHFQPYEVQAITQYGVGTDSAIFKYTVNFEHNGWRGFDDQFNEIDLTDDVNDIFIMVHERMKEHLDFLKVAY